MKIYTKTGDDGTTALFSGGRVTKDHLRVEAYGTVDELNSVIGIARAHSPSRKTDILLEHIQKQLFHLGADLATPLDAKADWIIRITDADIEWLEQSIDEMTSDLSELKNFILPGGSLVGAHLHLARTIARRAERWAVRLSAQEAIGEQVIRYLNRLSDWLFTLARWENRRVGVKEEKWVVRNES